MDAGIVWTAVIILSLIAGIVGSCAEKQIRERTAGVLSGFGYMLLASALLCVAGNLANHNQFLKDHKVLVIVLAFMISYSATQWRLWVQTIIKIRDLCRTSFRRPT